MNDVLFETDRLIVRRFQASDVYDFNEYARVPGVGESAGWLPHQSLEESKMILDKFIDNPFQFAIVYKSNNKVIGSISLNDKEVSKQLFGDDTKELGYVLSKEYWGQRLMREVVVAMIDCAFNEFGLDKLAVCHFIENTQSKSVILNAGFKYVTQNEEYSDILSESRVLDYYILQNS